MRSRNASTPHARAAKRHDPRPGTDHTITRCSTSATADTAHLGCGWLAISVVMTTGSGSRFSGLSAGSQRVFAASFGEVPLCIVGEVWASFFSLWPLASTPARDLEGVRPSEPF
jgi:hypothetical protein